MTTVRFDTESWNRLHAAADSLGIPRGAYIREAVQARITRTETNTELQLLTDRVQQLEDRMTVVLRALQRRGR